MGTTNGLASYQLGAASFSCITSLSRNLDPSAFLNNMKNFKELVTFYPMYSSYNYYATTTNSLPTADDCMLYIEQFSPNNTYTYPGQTPSSSAYIIFRISNVVAVNGNSAVITNTNSSGPTEYQYQASDGSLATDNPMYVNLGIETVPFTTTGSNGGTPVIVAYIANDPTSDLLVSSLVQPSLSQTAPGVPQPILNTPTSKPIPNSSGSSYTYTLASAGGINMATSSVSTGYSSPSPAVSGMTTSCAFYQTSALTKANIIGGTTTFTPSSLTDLTPVSVTIPATGTPFTPTTTPTTPCATLLSGLSTGGVSYSPATATTAISAGVSFVIYNTLSGASSVSIYNF
jgi:hypothetical protein